MRPTLEGMLTCVRTRNLQPVPVRTAHPTHCCP